MTSRFATVGLLALVAATAHAARLLHGAVGDYAAVPSRRGDGGTLKIESVSERGVIRHTSLAGRYRPVESSR